MENEVAENFFSQDRRENLAGNAFPRYSINECRILHPSTGYIVGSTNPGDERGAGEVPSRRSESIRSC